MLELEPGLARKVGAQGGRGSTQLPSLSRCPAQLLATPDTAHVTAKHLLPKRPQLPKDKIPVSVASGLPKTQHLRNARLEEPWVEGLLIGTCRL